jgi:L-alanine-DL-glutamate epimerase-like enolase superfamily enzyme
MKITSVTATAVSVPRVQSFLSSLGTHTHTENAVVEITTDEGISGFGEAASIWEHKGRGEAELINNALADVVVGTDPFCINQAVALMNQRLPDAWPAKSGIEMALFDIVGKALGRPVYDLLGGRVRDRLMLCRSLSMGPVDDIVAQARLLADEGYKTLKAKIGNDAAADLALVSALRGAFPDIILRADANMGWKSEDAVHQIRALEEFDLELVEQPVPGDDLDGMRLIREAVEVPIMADESVWTSAHALACIKANAADIFNVYVAEAGGLSAAAAVFTVAEAAGIPCLIGSMPELGIGTAAQAHLAFAMRNIGFACDVNGFVYQSDDVCDHGLRIKDGYLYPPRGPGLGIEVDKARVDQYRVA